MHGLLRSRLIWQRAKAGTYSGPGSGWTGLGAQVLSTGELIALVWGTGAARRALELAERLYVQYGGLVGIAQLGLAELGQVEGIGQAKAVQLRAALELGERLTLEALGERPQIKSPADAAALLLPGMSLLDQERLRTLLLDTRSRVMGMQDVYQGNLNSITIRPSEVFREAVKRNSAAIIVAHNHPSADASPSAEDVRSTKLLIEAGKVLDIALVDHLIIGRGGQYVSLKERGLAFD